MAATTISHEDKTTSTGDNRFNAIEKRVESSVTAISPSETPSSGSDKGEITADEEDVSIALKAANIDAVPSLIKDINSFSDGLDSDDSEARLKLMAKAKSLWQSLETPRETMLRHTWAEVGSNWWPTVTSL
jgi:hypothetical protein